MIDLCCLLSVNCVVGFWLRHMMVCQISEVRMGAEVKVMTSDKICMMAGILCRKLNINHHVKTYILTWKTYWYQDWRSLIYIKLSFCKIWWPHMKRGNGIGRFKRGLHINTNEYLSDIYTKTYQYIQIWCFDTITGIKISVNSWQKIQPYTFRDSL